MPPSKWATTQPNWIPLRNAAFSFGLAPDGSCVLANDTWWHELGTLLTKVSDADEVRFYPATSAFLFCYKEKPHGVSSFIGSPWILLVDPERMAAAIHPRAEAEALFDPNLITLSEEDAQKSRERCEKVRKAVSLVWNQYILHALNRAIEQKFLTLFARPHEVSSEFVELPADIWPHLIMENWALGNAFARDGTVFSSIHAKLMHAKKEETSPPTATHSPRRRGAKPHKRAPLREAMLSDLREGRLTAAELENMLEKNLMERYDAKRTTARIARDEALEAFRPNRD